MNKAQLAALVVGEAGLPRADVERTVGTVFTVISDALASGKDVAAAGFGTFSARDRPAREGRNPRTGETIAIAASTAPAFKAGSKLRETVNRRA